MQPNLGAGIREMLFENMTPGTLKLIEERVVDTIEIYEPRAELIDVAVEQIDEQQVNVTVLFYVTNEEQPIQLDVILERNR
jgi:phage baseplate assembly protein W